MRNLLLLLFSLFLQQNMIAQCCQSGISSTSSFAMLGKDEGFVASHDAPLPFVLENEKGKMITFTTSDGSSANAYEVKATRQNNNWLLVFHEWWGLNDYIRREADRFHSELGGINVLAIDLYDGKVAETPAMAQQLMSGLIEERAKVIVDAAIQHTGKNARILTIGWCMGGGWSLQAALKADSKTAGCVMYYGMPESDISKLKKLKSDVLGIFASRDKWITPEVVGEFENAMKSAGKKLYVKNYDADHAFANPSSPRYDEKNASEARKQAIAYLKGRIK